MYAVYSGWVYTHGTTSVEQMSEKAVNGKQVWHNKNCQNCHQIFGLGGYMGPDLTTVTGDKNRGALYAKAMIMNGGAVMPNFHFTEDEANDLIAYLEYINKIAAYRTK